MYLSQLLLFKLSLASFVTGAVLSLVGDFLYAMQLWLASPSKRYTVPTIQRLHKKLKKSTSIKGKGRSLQIALIAEDILLCLLASVALILLLYWINNGVFRVAAPLFMAAGFWICRISISKYARIVFQWVCFGVETLLHLLWMPFKYFFARIVKRIRKNARKRRMVHLAKARQKRTKQELKDIEKTAKRILPIF